MRVALIILAIFFASLPVIAHGYNSNEGAGSRETAAQDLLQRYRYYLLGAKTRDSFSGVMGSISVENISIPDGFRRSQSEHLICQNRFR